MPAQIAAELARGIRADVDDMVAAAIARVRVELLDEIRSEIVRGPSSGAISFAPARRPRPKKPALVSPARAKTSLKSARSMPAESKSAGHVEPVSEAGNRAGAAAPAGGKGPLFAEPAHGAQRDAATTAAPCPDAAVRVHETGGLRTSSSASITAPRASSTPAWSRALVIAPSRSMPVPAPAPAVAESPRSTSAAGAGPAWGAEDDAEDRDHWIAKLQMQYSRGPQLSRDTLIVCDANLGRTCEHCPIRRECEATTRASNADLAAFVARLNAAAAAIAPGEMAPEPPPMHVEPSATCAVSSSSTQASAAAFPASARPVDRGTEPSSVPDDSLMTSATA